MSLTLKKTFPRESWGHVTIAGFGPGNPELLTVKALSALQQADAIFYDDLLDASYLDNFEAEKVYVGKRSTNHAFRQEAINHKLWEAAVAGKNVVRLKGGDPFIFGRGIEEYHYLAERSVDVEIVPGISSAMAAAADALVPLTARGISSSVAFVSGHDLEKLVVPKAETLVVFMGASNQAALAQRLMAEDWDPATPVAVTRNASYADAETRRYTLTTIQETTDLLPSPAIMMIGWTAAPTPDGARKKWLYTGSGIQNFNEADGVAVHSPLISVEGDYRENPDALDQQDHLLFTGRNAVEHFFKYLRHHQIDIRQTAAMKISALTHSASVALKERGLLVDPLVPADAKNGFAQLNRWISFKNERILIPQSGKGMPLLLESLKQTGNTVSTLTVYATLRHPRPIRHDLNGFYGVVFTSALTVEHFHAFYGSFPDQLVYRFGNKIAEAIFHELRDKEKTLSEKGVKLVQ
ncbi:uroporphyrinogen-III C-methyltransferase [Geofilum rubicundum]|uniref:uroporphyrinogen-III C-methyltransferase n=1 Tax=Geofilum rubicundum TaxID=472113 RepID=UPI000781FA2B|nr:uroporphyrinogen-III C-methyltransferase [Geofilum rubicundum]